MAAKTFLRQIAGVITEIKGTQTSAGVANAGDLLALDDTGRIDNSAMPTGIGADTAAVQASEALAAGDLVNIWSSTGSFRARKADASVAGKEAHGFVLSAVSSGASATVYFAGRNTAVTGLTPGTLFLSATTPGGTTSTAPSGSAQVVQRVGVAVVATEMNFESTAPITLAT